MNEAKRFDPVGNCIEGTMTVRSDGDYVRYEAYADLQATIEELEPYKKACNEWSEMYRAASIRNTEYIIENEQLKEMSDD